MPVAQVNLEAVSYNLKTLENGFVKLRRLTFGEKKARQDMIRLTFDMGGDKKKKDMQGEIAMANRTVTQFEFSKCIVEHNLQKSDGTDFNFSTPNDFELLDPRVGEEIDSYIGELNNFEVDEGN